MGKKILVSACLLGKNCRYNGGNSQISDLDETDVNWISVCPEEAGDLGIPRPAAELQNDPENILMDNGKIMNVHGEDVTDKFIQGAKKSLEIGIDSGVKTALLKSRSPSCGSGLIYDGSFSNKMVQGEGIFAFLCKEAGIKVINSEDDTGIKKIIQKLK